MIHAITFDTFRYAKELKKAGFTEIQVDTQVKFAKEQTDTINDFIDSNIATKQDIKETQQNIKEIQKDIKELELKMELKMELIKKDLTIKLVGILGSMIIICVGASTTILGFLLQVHH